MCLRVKKETNINISNDDIKKIEKYMSDEKLSIDDISGLIYNLYEIINNTEFPITFQKIINKIETRGIDIKKLTTLLNFMTDYKYNHDYIRTIIDKIHDNINNIIINKNDI